MRHLLFSVVLFLASHFVMGQTIDCVERIADPIEHLKWEQRVEESLISKSFDQSTKRFAMVIHVIYVTRESGSTTGKVSEEQMASAIDDANEWFNLHYGSGAYDGDMNIEIYLPNIDPEGNPTTGIIYHDIDDSGLSESEKQEYKDYGVRASSSLGVSFGTIAAEYGWDRDKYINYYIVTEFDGNGAGGGVQGAAYFPTSATVYGGYNLYNAMGDLAKGYYDTNGDESYSSFNPDSGDARRNLKSYTDLNKTFIHEVGHLLGLRHPFGNSCSIDSDGIFVDDTGPTTVNQSCNSLACSTATPDLHMDYFPQDCRLRFTPGQVDYAHAALDNHPNDIIENFDSVHVWKETTVDLDFELPVTVCEIGGDFEVKVTNTGAERLEKIKLVYGSDYATTDTVERTVCLLPGQYKTIYLPAIDNNTGTVGVKAIEVNTFPVNNEPVVDSSILGDVEITIEFNPDVLGGQNGWTLIHNNSGTIVNEVESYPNFASEEVFTTTTCVPGGCYTFTFTDAVGNGICCQNGEGYLNVYVNGELYAELPDDFTDVWTVSNCESQASIELQPQKVIIGYYNFMGEYLGEAEPEKGWYIIRYSDNSYEKILKR